MIICQSINNEHYKIEFTNTELYIWRYAPISLSKNDFWIYNGHVSIKNDKIDWSYQFGKLPFELIKFCERFIQNKAFW